MKMVLAVLAFLAGAPLLEGFDVPLMPGLAEQADSRLTFDKEEGSIVETVLEGAVPRDQVRDYYAKALAGLGWTLADSQGSRQVYRRGGDQLIIDYAGEGDTTRMRLLLEPVEPRP
ncbi:hypothetical protein [Pedomonas mirosovicensis]|uniref:hypothetical protein n=1 Tax=Pedomonas mirosovicensis TaxID=2908641 RepID=UPI00216861C7|nr:hypothetical protein [Pedomonas mirosovicensis]MCH8683906.1 hypothetical protein [Pedomonas mirosovicensis]